MKRKQSMVMSAGITGALGILTSILIFKNSSVKRMEREFLRKDECSHKNFFLGSMVGGLAGAALSFLFAPQSGKDLIKNILRHLHVVESRAGKIRPLNFAKVRVKKRPVKPSGNVKDKNSISRKSPVKKPGTRKKVRAANLDTP